MGPEDHIDIIHKDPTFWFEGPKLDKLTSYVQILMFLWPIGPQNLALQGGSAPHAAHSPGSRPALPAVQRFSLAPRPAQDPPTSGTRVYLHQECSWVLNMRV